MDTTSAASPSLKRPTVDARTGGLVRVAPFPSRLNPEGAADREPPEGAKELSGLQDPYSPGDGLVTHAPLQG